MSWSKVTKYNLGFNIVDKQFYFYYALEGENVVHQIFLDAAQFAAVSDMFRNEGPVSYNSDGHYFVTDPEGVGEGEVAPASAGTSFTGTIKGTWRIDLDTGQLVGDEASFDLWWEQLDAVHRRLVGLNGAKMVRFGAPSYESISLEQLKAAVFPLDSVEGSSTPANQLTAGTVLGVRSGAGRYSKLQVTTYGYDLGIRWTIYG